MFLVHNMDRETNLANNYQRHQKRMQRRYTFTRSKAVVGFLFSTFLSIILSTYFDRYGVEIMRQAMTLVGVYSADSHLVEAESEAAYKVVDGEEDSYINDDFSNLRERIRANR